MEALEQSVIGPLVGRSEQTYGVDVQIRVLGPIEVVRDDVEVRLGGPKQRTTLALLAADVGKVVSVDALIDGLWGDEPTAGARSTLQTYVSNLRGELGDVIVREGSGYRLDVDPEQVDAVQFERELVRAHELAQANPAETSQRIRSALALWRGHPYAGVPASFRLELEASRLEELRLGALETRIEAELALGHHAELVPELEVLCTEYPVREGFRAQHMLALYRSGRQAEALRAFQKTRAYLAEELGLEPSTQLRELEHRILNQDSTLELESEPQVQTLALLLTDIEDSTVLWEMQTAAMRSAVAEHDRIVFGAVEAAGGRVVKRVGDGIDTAFANAGAAVRAAEQIQRELFAVDWGDTGPLAVRMAIDLGAVEARRGDYFGPVLNRAGRMLAAGHGGQVLLSSDAHAALAATESGWQAKALGEFRFKGIGSPQSVFQLLLDGLPAEFAPLRIDRLPPLVPALAFGRALRGYELRENVGSGDFGIVYRAYQPSVGREVAIKVIRPELVNQLSFVRRFEAEAQLIAQLEHPHIVSLYDYWRDPDGAYLVMRWLRGGSLRQALERGPWHAEPAARLLAQIGGALAYAHRQGVVHGDLKPGNVLLDDEGHAYLSDFGIATRSGDSAEPGRVVSSSPAYVPPEELAADAKTPRSDIYSLGLLTFELLTGRRPPMDGALPSVTDVRPELPQDVNAVVAKATAHEPDERHATVEAFLAAFGQALGAPAPAVTYTPAENPYKGLRAFGEADADDFFGRDALAAELVAAVRDHRLVALVGPSGIGKSSVVRAGLIPALRRGMSAESVSWVISDMFPGSYPFEELAAALLRVAVERPDDLMQQLSRDELGMSRVMKRILPPGGELLLVVDQFEELFTLTADEDDRQRFLDGLTRLAADGRSRVRVVVTLRADFLDHPLRYPEFGELVKAGMVAVTAPSDDDLALAIERPAARAGVRFEPGVVSHVIGDVRDQPGALPLLQYALTELFAARTSDVLTLEAYRATGGVVGALGRRAEELYGRLDNAGQAATRQVFLRLVTVDSQAQDTRRRVRRRELRRLEIEPTVLETILAQYGEHRLLTFDREALTRSPTVEVAHEALLTQWERLRSWVDERREDLLLQRRLVEAVQEWEESGRQADYLPRAGRLAQFESWAGATDLALTAGEREFLAEARTAAEAAARRRARRRRAILAGFAFLAIVASVLAAFGFVQREDARAAATVAEAQRLGSQALVEDDLDRSLLLARTGVAVDDSVQTQGNLLAALLRSPAAIAVMQGDGDRLLELDLSPDGRTLAVGDNDGTVVFLDPQTGRRVGRPIHVPGSVLGVVFTPDGSSLVIAGAGRSGFVRLYDARSRALRTKLPVVMREGEAPAETVVSPDGGMIAVTLFTDRPASPPARAVRWDARTGRPLGRPVDVVNGDLVGGLAFTRDAKQLLIGGGGRLTVWDARTMKRVRSFPGDAFSIATAPDGRTIAFGARRDGTVTFLDLVTGAQRKGGGRHAASVQGVAFSPDGTTLVSTGDDRKVIVWDVASGTERETLEGHAGRVHAQDFSPDGNTVYTASLDARMIAWDVEGARRVGRPLRHSDSPEANIASVVSSDGKTFATVAQDGTVRFRRLVTGSVVGKPLRGFRGEVVWIALSPDGRTLAAVGAGGPGILWDTHTGVRRELGGWTAERSGWASFSADGKTLVTGGTEVSLWDIATGRRIADFNAGGYMSEASLSPDGTMLATAGDGGRVIIWDVEERMRITELKADENFASTARFSPDGKLLATGGVDGNAILWNTKTWQRVGRPLGGHAGFVITVDFDEDGGTLASSSTDGNVRLWDVASGRQVGSGLPGPGNQWSTVHFVPNAKRLLAVYATGIALVWDVDPERWKRQACTVAGRNLTRAEWDEFLPGRDYRAVCP